MPTLLHWIRERRASPCGPLLVNLPVSAVMALGEHRPWQFMTHPSPRNRETLGAAPAGRLHQCSPFPSSPFTNAYQSV
jgi:hypothetical protein